MSKTFSIVLDISIDDELIKEYKQPSTSFVIRNVTMTAVQEFLETSIEVRAPAKSDITVELWDPEKTHQLLQQLNDPLSKDPSSEDAQETESSQQEVQDSIEHTDSSEKIINQEDVQENKLESDQEHPQSELLESETTDQTEETNQDQDSLQQDLQDTEAAFLETIEEVNSDTSLNLELKEKPTSEEKEDFDSHQNLEDHIQNQQANNENLQGLKSSPDVLRYLSKQEAQKMQVLPLRNEGDILVCAAADPEDSAMINKLRLRTGKRIVCVQVSKQIIHDSLEQAYRTLINTQDRDALLNAFAS